MKSYHLLYVLGLLVSSSTACLASSSSSAIDAEKEAQRQAVFQHDYQSHKESFLRCEQKGNAVDLGFEVVRLTSFIERSEKVGARFDEDDLRAFLNQHDVGNKFKMFLGGRLFRRGEIQGGIDILTALPHGQLLIAHAYEDLKNAQKADEIYQSLIRSFTESDPIAGEMHPRLHYANFLWRTHVVSGAASQFARLMNNPLYIPYASMQRYRMHVFFRESQRALVYFYNFLSVLETVTANNMTGLCLLFEHSATLEPWEQSLFDMLRRDKIPFEVVEIFERRVHPLEHTFHFTGFAEGNISRKAEPFSHKIQCSTPRHYPVKLEKIGWNNIYKY